MFLLGYDIGSSSIKVSLVELLTGHIKLTVQYPSSEMEISAPHASWAEQKPSIWWDNLVEATKKLLKQSKVNPTDILGIGIAYQMHGLVIVDKDHKVLRPSIIWCDSRSVDIGNKAFENLGESYCQTHLLNSPGNFTASKLKWVKDNEPEVYEKIYKFMLPGDYINMMLSGDINTTVPGLSEAILWDYSSNTVAKEVLDQYGISSAMVPEIVDTFGIQSRVSKKAAEQIGLKEGTPICYRAGDQPNNALSLGVFRANEVAASGGTSGVIYGVTDQLLIDKNSQINSFAHVNYTVDDPKIGLLLCINGAGIQYAWMQKMIAHDKLSYDQMEELARKTPIGAENLSILPFGNGAERMLMNQNPGAHIAGLQFNRHTSGHMYRAALEGIAFSFVYGFGILKKIGLQATSIRVGNDNLFRSYIFSSTMATLLGVPIELKNTNGATGAAKAAGIGLGKYSSIDEAFSKLRTVRTFRPYSEATEYKEAYEKWYTLLSKILSQNKLSHEQSDQSDDWKYGIF